MRVLVLADLHANRAALSAILGTREAEACEAVVSLGDQFNYGPCPAETLGLLRDFCRRGGRPLTLLQGNHEERLAHLGELTGANWALLHWSAARAGAELAGLPVDVRLAEGRVLCTHGTPGDPYRLVDAEGAAEVLAALAETEPACRLLLSGHNHIRWRVRDAEGRQAVNPGAAGMWEDGTGLRAPFCILSTEAGGEPEVTLLDVPYDGAALERDFVRSGCFLADPVLPRMVLTIMRTGERHAMLYYMRHARRVAEEMGAALGDPAAWRAADAAWPWTDGRSTEAFWTELEAKRG